VKSIDKMKVYLRDEKAGDERYCKIVVLPTASAQFSRVLMYLALTMMYSLYLSYSSSSTFKVFRRTLIFVLVKFGIIDPYTLCSSFHEEMQSYLC